MHLAACVQFLCIDWLFEVGRDSRELGTRVGISTTEDGGAPSITHYRAQRKVKRKDFVEGIDCETTDVTANWRRMDSRE